MMSWLAFTMGSVATVTKNLPNSLSTVPRQGTDRWGVARHAGRQIVRLRRNLRRSWDKSPAGAHSRSGVAEKRVLVDEPECRGPQRRDVMPVPEHLARHRRQDVRQRGSEHLPDGLRRATLRADPRRQDRAVEPPEV